jgi:hypothetical protein
VSFWQWLAHVLGLDNLSGPFYGFWSGVGSDLGELTIIGAAASIYWRHTCHVKRCYRIGRHPVQGTPHVVCRKHHPTGEPTHEEILRQHKEAN